MIYRARMFCKSFSTIGTGDFIVGVKKKKGRERKKGAKIGEGKESWFNILFLPLNRIMTNFFQFH